MECVELASTAAPTAVKEGLKYYKEKPAQSAFQDFAKDVEREFSRFSSKTARNIVGDKVATLGSNEMIYCRKDDGIFSAVLTAYNNHWKLRTSPDDWWFCVVKKVSLAIDKNAEKKAVRNLFVEHEGKKTLTVGVPSLSIYDVDYRLVSSRVFLKDIVRTG